MQYKVSDILHDVRIILDENGVSVPLTSLGDVDTLSLNTLIESKIEDAARIVELQAPLHLLSANGSDFGSGQGVNWHDSTNPGIGSGYIALPTDFLRLICFRMSDWAYPVSEVIYPHDPRYALQHSRYQGVKGNPQSPVVAIQTGESSSVLEFYSCDGGEDVTVSIAKYLKEPKIATSTEGNGDEAESYKVIDLCDKLFRAILYYTAYLVSCDVAPAVSSHFLSISKELAEIFPQ